MAKTLEGYKFKRGKTGESAYNKYMDGQVWEIDCKVDHPGCGSASSVLASLSTKARKLGKKIRSSGVSSDDKLIVQAYTPE